MTLPFYIRLDREAGVYRPADPRAAAICCTSATDSTRAGIRETQYQIVSQTPGFEGLFHFDPNDLTDHRREVFEMIELNTRAIVNRGFEFQGRRFANNLDSRAQYTALYAMRDDPFMQWPIEFATLDDMDMIELPDSQAAYAFCLTSAGAFLGVKATGTALKKQVKTLTTAEELSAFVDPRVQNAAPDPLPEQQETLSAAPEPANAEAPSADEAAIAEGPSAEEEPSPPSEPEPA